MRAVPVFKRTRTVCDADIDAFGHVNNLVWIRFIVELADAHSRAAGLDPPAYKKIGGFWIVRRHEIDYHAPALPDERIVEETWISRLRGARSVRRCRFAREIDGKRLVSSTTHWAYVDAQTQRPRRIDAGVLQRFQVLADD